MDDAPHSLDGRDEPGVASSAMQGAAATGRSRASLEPAAGALPTLLIIGAPKCGTSSLHRYLDAHPEIGMSRHKELCFFIDEIEVDLGLDAVDVETMGAMSRGRWSRGVEWYRRQFDPTRGVRGESSVGYMNPWYRCAERIAALVPDVMLIACLRDPVERALSSYRFLREAGVERRPIDQAVHPASFYAHQSRYASNLAPYLEHFPREQLLIVETEQLAAERRATLAGLYERLGVDPGFWSDELELRWNVTGATERRGLFGRALLAARRRSSWWQPIATRAPAWVSRRTFGVDAAAEVVRDSRDVPAVETVDALRAALRPEAGRVRELTGMEFAGWSV